MIEKLVSDLPEIYQPIYGHPELSGQVSRSCLDRLEHIVRIHDALQRLFGRPLMVLDLGCAQGYFSLHLAKRGAFVQGIDFLDKNVAVCNALAQENPALQVRFSTGRVEAVIASLQPGQYDLVLGLSVFHHIVHEKGLDAVKAMLEHAAERSSALVVELALREEPLYWAPSQPEHPRDLLDSIAFVHEVARHGTHLAPIPRPLFVVSNRYWILEDQASRFDSWSFEPHNLAQGTHQTSRRYFFSSDRILKLYRFDHARGEHNKTEFIREVDFLQKPPPEFTAPELIAFGEGDTEAWIAMQRLPGRLLLDLQREGVNVDSRGILLAVLEQLAALESAGLYHDDVRTWNVLVAEDGTTHLIDYGSISSQVRDCEWPGNPFLALIIFVREVVTGVVDNPVPLRTVSISPFGLPQPYRNWAMVLWHRPLNEWSFRFMHQTLLDTPAEMSEEPTLDANSAWMKAIEEAIQAQKLFVNHVSEQAEVKVQLQQALNVAQAAQAQSQALEQERQARALSAELENTRNELHAVHQANHSHWTQLEQTKQELHAVHQSNHNHWQLAEQRQAHVNALLNSTSWRITAPLRWPVHQLRLLRAHGFKQRAKAAVKKVLRKLVPWVVARPKLKSLATQLAYKLGVAERLKPFVRSLFANHQQPLNQHSPQQTFSDLTALTPRARQIYHDLKLAIEIKQKGGA
jgi:O-antigen chain-terminating methyltransferase